MTAAALDAVVVVVPPAEVVVVCRRKSPRKMQSESIIVLKKDCCFHEYTVMDGLECGFTVLCRPLQFRLIRKSWPCEKPCFQFPNEEQQEEAQFQGKLARTRSDILNIESPFR